LESLLSVSSFLQLRKPLPSMRGMAISPDFAAILIEQIRTRRPRTIVELGCGVSTIVSSYTIEQLGYDGRIVSIDHESEYAEICRRRLDEHGLSHIATVYECPLRDQNVNGAQSKYYGLSKANLPDEIDMLVVDGPPFWVQKRARYPALPLLIGRLKRDAVVIVDDAGRDDERAIVQRWLEEFSDFEHSYISTEKGTSILKRQLQRRVNAA
jgi:predicted O-methyltransferase YrrM